MTDIDLKEMREIAEKARCLWESIEHFVAQKLIVGLGTCMSNVLCNQPEAVKHFAATARPTNVLALLDRLEAAEAERDAARALLKRAGEALSHSLLWTDEEHDVAEWRDAARLIYAEIKGEIDD